MNSDNMDTIEEIKEKREIEDYIKTLSFEQKEVDEVLEKLQDLKFEYVDEIKRHSLQQLELLGFSGREAEILKNQKKVTEESSEINLQNKIKTLFPHINNNIYEQIYSQSIQDYKSFKQDIDQLKLYQFQKRKIQLEISKQQLHQFIKEKLVNQKLVNQVNQYLNQNGVQSISDLLEISHQDLQQLELKEFQIKLIKLNQKLKYKKENSNFYHLIWDTKQIIQYDLENKFKNYVNFDVKIPHFSQFIETNKNVIYCIGGYNDKFSLNTNLEFDMNQFKSILKQQLNQNRHSTSLVYNKHSHSIYAIGGSYNQNSSSLKSCEEYIIQSNKWNTIQDLNYERTLASSILMNKEYLYTFGGYHNTQHLNLIEKYYINNNKWEYIELKIGIQKANRMQLLKLSKNNILICGGENSYLVQFFNIKNNSIKYNTQPINEFFPYNYIKKYKNRYYMPSGFQKLLEYDIEKNEFKVIEDQFT